MSKATVFPTALTDLRDRLKLSREKIAQILDVTTPTLARYENGVSDIPIGIAEEMAIIYNIPFDELRNAIKSVKTARGVKITGKISQKDMRIPLKKKHSSYNSELLQLLRDLQEFKKYKESLKNNEENQ